MFYYNTVTQESSWEVPTATVQAIETTLQIPTATEAAPPAAAPAAAPAADLGAAAPAAEERHKLVVTSPLVDTAVTIEVLKGDNFGAIVEMYKSELKSRDVGGKDFASIYTKQLDLVWNMKILPQDKCLSDTQILTETGPTEVVQILALGAGDASLPVYGAADAVDLDRDLPTGWHYEDHPDGGYYW